MCAKTLSAPRDLFSTTKTHASRERMRSTQVMYDSLPSKRPPITFDRTCSAWHGAIFPEKHVRVET